jgi:predicted N-formylglutamate amidohydrolase
MMFENSLQNPGLLGPGDPAPVDIRNPAGASPFLLICDHAGNAVPAALHNLGLPQAELDRHIGIDIGILGVTELLSDLLDAPLIFQRYSRLVIEANRRLSSSESVTLVSDGTKVPGNAALSPAARQARIDEIFTPYHREIVRCLDDRAVRGLPTVLISMHSFTPSLRSRPFQRPWEVGLCFGDDDRFTKLILAVLEREGGLSIGRNEPYGVDMSSSYSIPVYGEERGLPYAEFEIRQDLITAAAGQVAWADRVAAVLREAYGAFTDRKDYAAA